MGRGERAMVVCAVCIVATSVIFLAANPDDFDKPGYVPFMGLLTLVTGAWLFWLRSRHRLIYGGAEIIAGVVTALFALKTFGENLPRPNAFDAPMLGTYLSLAAGLYIVVRGLDNIGQAIRKGSKFHRIWTALFGA